MLAQLIELLPLLFKLIPGLYELIFFLAHGDEKITSQVKAQLFSGLDDIDEAIKKLQDS